MEFVRLLILIYLYAPSYNIYHMMNQLKRKVVVSSQEAIKKDQPVHPQPLASKDQPNSDEQHRIESMATRKQPSPIVTQQLRNPNHRHNKPQTKKNEQSQPQQGHGKEGGQGQGQVSQGSCKVPQKLLQYHRNRKEDVIVDGPELRIDMKPADMEKEREKQEGYFEDNSNKLPYRFQS